MTPQDHIALLNRIFPPSVLLPPALLAFAMPFLYRSSIRLKTIPSHPLAAIMSTVTGRNSLCCVIVEKYSACPTIHTLAHAHGLMDGNMNILGTTISGAPEKMLIVEVA
jgi:hypothetical protein